MASEPQEDEAEEGMPPDDAPPAEDEAADEGMPPDDAPEAGEEAEEAPEAGEEAEEAPEAGEEAEEAQEAADAEMQPDDPEPAADEQMQQEAADEEMPAAEAASKPSQKEAADEEMPPAEAAEDTSQQEREQDAPDDDRPRIAGDSVFIRTCDTTLNVMQVHGGDLLMPLIDGGFQHLVAAARANIGVKAGRYLFEAKVVETRTGSDEPKGKSKDGKSRASSPGAWLWLGFSTLNSSLFLNEGGTGVGFDSEATFILEGSRASSGRARPFEVLAVVLNLDSSSPNKDTISVFRDGERLCAPRQLPPSLKGKTLFPTINFKGVTVQLNFGPELASPLPFRCLTVMEAAEDDVDVLQEANAEKEVIFPVALPDEGTFDWLDTFLKDHPGYVEVSDRAVLEWARISNLRRSRGYEAQTRVSNDRPGMDFNIRDMDDFSCRRMIQSLSTGLKRNFVVMEVRNNLIAAERQKALQRYQGFKKVAMVVMGEPPEEYKEKMQAMMLEAKTNKAQDASSSTEGLTDEEKSLWFRKPIVPDLSPKDLSHYFPNFSIPSKEEGFEEVKFVWKSEAESREYLKTWIAERKLTERVEDLHPSEWFREKHAERQALIQEWRRKYGTYYKDTRRHATNGQTRSRSGGRRSRSRRRTAGDPEGDNGENKPDSRTGESEGMDADGQEDGQEAEASNKVNAEDLDVYAVENVLDIGNGEPLFANFTWEDWELLRLRLDLHLLVYAYKHDLNDPERESFHHDHLLFYYEKYIRKSLTPKNFGVPGVVELIDLVKDTVGIIPRKGLIECHLAEDTPLDNFVKLTEDERRERERHIDLGDESAALKFLRPSGSEQRGRSSGAAPSGYNSRGTSGGHSRGRVGAPSHSSGGTGGRPMPPPPTRHGGTPARASGFDDRQSGAQVAPSSGGGYGGHAQRSGGPSTRHSGPPPVGAGYAPRAQAATPVGGQAHRYPHAPSAAGGRRADDSRASAPYGGQESRRAYYGGGGGGGGSSYNARGSGGPPRGDYGGRPAPRGGGTMPPPTRGH